MSAGTQLYLVSKGLFGPVKIGVSDRPGARLSTLQTGNDAELVLAATSSAMSRKEALDLESRAHNAFHTYGLRGEWFSVDSLTVLNEHALGLTATQGFVSRIENAREAAAALVLGETGIRAYVACHLGPPRTEYQVRACLDRRKWLLRTLARISEEKPVFGSDPTHAAKLFIDMVREGYRGN